MRKTAKLISTAASLAALLGSLALVPAGAANAAGNDKAAMSAVEQGRKIAFNRKLGNCLACHQMGDGTMAGTFGPPLVAMKSRFPDKAKLRAQIWDATVANPNTSMPPFGRNKILTESQIDKVVDYVWTL